MQYSQHSIGHYAFEVKALEDRYDTKLNKGLQVIERDVKDILTQILRG